MNTNVSIKDFLTPAWVLIVIGLIVGGGVGLYEIFIGHITATSQVIMFTNSLIVYIALALASTGISLILAYGLLTGRQSIIANTRYLLILDIAVLMGGFVALATKMGSIPNLIWTFFSPNPESPIWWMSMLYTIKLTVLLIKLLRDVLGMHGAIDRPLAVITMVAAAGAAMTIGSVFGTAIARPDFQGAYASVLLVLLAPMAGAALVVFMGRGRELVTNVAPVFRHLAVLVAVLLAVQWVYETRSTVEGLLGWVNPLMVVLFALSAAIAGMAPRVAGALALLGVYWICYSFIIIGQLAVFGPLQGWYGEVTSFSPNLAELMIIVLGVAVASALYQLGRIFLLDGSTERERVTAQPA